MPSGVYVRVKPAYIRTEASKQKNRIAHLGKKHSRETCLKIGLGHRGIIFSEERCTKISNAKLGKKLKPLTMEWRRNIGLGNKGKIRSEEFKRKVGEMHRGPKCNFWQGGIGSAPYPLGWTRTHKEQIRQRDHYKCQLCGCSESECTTKLAVHHIDYIKENIDPDNLISLCTACHGKTNSNREYWKSILKVGGKIENLP